MARDPLRTRRGITEILRTLAKNGDAEAQKLLDTSGSVRGHGASRPLPRRLEYGTRRSQRVELAAATSKAFNMLNYLAVKSDLNQR
jgi:hypothetical protein